MRAAVRWIDTLLRRYGGIYEFTQDPECILRLQLMPAPHGVTICNEIISKGDPVLAVHVWNERMPGIPPSGANLEWALKLRRSIIFSFREVAKLMLAGPRYSQVRAVCGSSALFSFSDHTGGTQMMQRLGFTVLPYHRPLGRFGEFWENLFSWWLMWTYNDKSLTSRKFWRLQRTEIWMTRAEFLQRFIR